MKAVRAAASMAAISILSMAFSPALCHGTARMEPKRSELIKKEKSLEDIKRKLREERFAAKKITEKETSILGELERVNINLSNKKEELKRLEAGLERIRRETALASATAADLEQDRKALTLRLKKRLKAMYKMGSLSRVGALMPDDADMAGYGAATKYMTVIAENDLSLIDRRGVAIARLEAEKARLAALKAEMEGERALIAVKKSETEAAAREKTALLNEVKREKTKTLKAIDELNASATELNGLLKRLREADEAVPAGASGFAAMKGRLPMPVEGRVVSAYGKVRHPKFQTVTFNNGITIEAAEGRPVRAVYDGKAAFTGWLKGYGQLIIVDNGNGFYTLFAHLQKTLKERGESIKKGEIIGLTGSTGGLEGPGLYFEIRERGIPRDPMSWVSSR